MKEWMKWAAAALAAGVLLGCGGGGSGGGAVSQGPDGSGTGSQLPAATLSENQRLFEEFTLAENGGQHTVDVYISLGQDAPGIRGVYASKYELPSTPAGLAAGVQGVHTPEFALLASMLPSSAKDSEANPNLGGVQLVNGQLLFYHFSAEPRVTYQGGDILTEILTASGQVAMATLIHRHEKVPLIGQLANAPEEFLRMFAFDSSHVNMTATFAAGSAYYKQSSTSVGDQVSIRDWDGDTDVDPQSATPLSVGETLEAFMARHDGSFPWDASADGAIRELNGARCWVRNVPIKGQPAFTSYCSVGGNVYLGRYRPDGSAVGSAYPVAPTGTTNAYLAYEAFTVRLNEAAVNSMKAMFH